MKKRILSFVLALVMAVSLLPVSVLAAEDEPAVKSEYSPPDSDVKVIGTYQVDEDTTWDVRLVTVDSTKYNYIQTPLNTKTGVISTEKYKVGDLVSGKYETSHYKGSETYESGIRLYDQMKDHLNLIVIAVIMTGGAIPYPKICGCTPVTRSWWISIWTRKLRTSPPSTTAAHSCGSISTV